MNYYTAEEARRIMDNTSVHLCTGYSNNPNREAFAECLRIALEPTQDPIHWAAVIGFHLGRATGIRQERARRRGEAYEQ